MGRGGTRPYHATLAEEHVPHLSRHVERREERAAQPHQERPLARLPQPRGVQDLVLAPEAGEQQRESRERQHANGVGRERHGHELTQAAHAPDVLLLVTAVNDRAGAEEEQRLEERVREQMEHPDRDATDAKAHEHEPELRHGGVSENAFDVRLRHSDERGEQRGDGADPSDDLERGGSGG